MYQNCCKKCGSTSLHTETKGNNVGLYCDDCGAWAKWLGKDELRAFEHSVKLKENPFDKIVRLLEEEKRRWELNDSRNLSRAPSIFAYENAIMIVKENKGE